MKPSRFGSIQSAIDKAKEIEKKAEDNPVQTHSTRTWIETGYQWIPNQTVLGHATEIASLLIEDYDKAIDKDISGLSERLAMLEGAVQGSGQPLTQEQVNQLIREQNAGLSREMQNFLRSEVQTQAQTAAGLFQKDKEKKKIKQKQASVNPFKKSAITQERFTPKPTPVNPFANIQKSSSPEITGEKTEDVVRHTLPQYMTALDDFDINNDKALHEASMKYTKAGTVFNQVKYEYGEGDPNTATAKLQLEQSKEAYTKELIRAKKKLYAKEMDATRQVHKATAKEIVNIKRKFLTTKISTIEEVVSIGNNTLADKKKIRSAHLNELRTLNSINEEDIVEYKARLTNALYDLISEDMHKAGRDYQEEDFLSLQESNDLMYSHQQKLAVLRNNSLPSAQTARELYLKNIDTEADKQIGILSKYRSTEDVLLPFDFSDPTKDFSSYIDTELVHDPTHDFMEDTSLLRSNQSPKQALSLFLKADAVLGELNVLRGAYSESIKDAQNTLAKADADFDRDYLEKSRLGQLTPQQRMGLIEARQDKLEKVTKPAVNVFRKHVHPSTGLQERAEHDPTWGILKRADSR